MSLLIEINGFGKWLKLKREARGLSMRTLAEKADNVCSPSYIAQLETNYYVGKRGNPMQPSEEIVERLAIALGESVNDARRAANYPFMGGTADEENLRFELFDVLPKYKRLSVKSRQFINRQLEEAVDFLLQIEGTDVERISADKLDKVEETEDSENLTKSPGKPEMLSDEEISRLGIKPIKVGKIKKEAR